MQSVGHAWAVLKGYRTGDPEEALSFLRSLSPIERILRNRNEQRLRVRARKRKIMPGQLPKSLRDLTNG